MEFINVYQVLSLLENASAAEKENEVLQIGFW